VNTDNSNAPWGHIGSPDWKGPGWYLITGKAGNRIPESTPGINHCGTQASGWLNGKHPAVPGQQQDMTVCFDWESNACWQSTTATVRNCGGYFLYKLPTPPAYILRYCGVQI